MAEIRCDQRRRRDHRHQEGRQGLPGEQAKEDPARDLCRPLLDSRYLLEQGGAVAEVDRDQGDDRRHETEDIKGEEYPRAEDIHEAIARDHEGRMARTARAAFPRGSRPGHARSSSASIALKKISWQGVASVIQPAQDCTVLGGDPEDLANVHVLGKRQLVAPRPGGLDPTTPILAMR